LKTKGVPIIQFGFTETHGVIEEGTLHIFPDTVTISNFNLALLQTHGACQNENAMKVQEFLSLLATGERNPRLIDKSIRKSLLIKMLKNAEMETHINVPSGFEEIFVDEIDELLPDLLSKRMLKLDVNIPERPLIEAYIEQYLNSIGKWKEENVFDSNSLTEEAISNTESISKYGIETVVFWEPYYLNALSGRLVSSISKYVNVYLKFQGRKDEVLAEFIEQVTDGVCSETSEPEKAALAYFGCPDKRREVEEVARGILHSIYEGCDADEIAVVSPDIENYLPEIEAVFREYGIIFERPGVRYELTSAGIFFSSALRVILERADRRNLMRFLSNFYLNLPQTTVEKCRRAMETLKEDLSEDIEKRNVLRKEIPSLMDKIADLRLKYRREMNGNEWKHLLSELYEMISAKLSSNEFRAIEGLLSGLIELLESQLLKNNLISPEEFLRLYRLFASSNRAPVGDLRYNGVFITDLALLNFRKFTRIFVLGFDENAAGRKYSGVFIKREMLHDLRSKCLSIWKYEMLKEAIERYVFHRTLALSKHVTLSWTYRERRETRLPSPLLIQEIKGQGKDGREIMVCIDRSTKALADYWPEEGNLLTPDYRRALSFNYPYTASKLDGFLEKRIRLAREIGEQGGHPWHFKDDELKRVFQSKNLSATDLNEHMKCPFRYIASRVLHIRPLEPAMNALFFGSMVHEVLYSVYSEYDISSLSSMSVEERKRIVSEKVENIIPDSPSQNFRYRALKDEVKKIVGNFIENDISFAPSERSVDGVEIEFGKDGNFNIGGYVFEGKMDRVERVRNALVITDYKTGRSGGFENKYFRKSGGIKDFEIPLYALYLSRKGRIAGGIYRYVGIGPRQHVAGFWVKEMEHLLNEEIRKELKIVPALQIPEMLSGFEQEIGNRARSIRDELNFSITPAENECRYCRYFSLCKYRRARS
jgi:hypothetical protein